MCFGSTKVPEVTQQPATAPAPVPSAPEPGEAVVSAEAKRKKIANLKYGALATIKNVGGAAGISGTGADLSSPAAGGKKTLGG